ncbi:hypothetical protein EV363DRAFT_1170909 [Boletus edulis]|uniref:Uncharacterized protein n=1 Tax=Boletus edulis BED1 TaxID=1328754 RepID=A0AAD4BPC6_BOLED|nr:hypothetical protein EV363DRAFT_1170909 [Boletus edulis]KAF8436044.1 hypothetical protein L210DRAFT_953227 [Boletus edulis BED1]
MESPRRLLPFVLNLYLKVALAMAISTMALLATAKFTGKASHTFLTNSNLFSQFRTSLRP